jgi:hypothetical protein
MQRMLVMDPNKRLSLQEIKQHPWFNEPVVSIEAFAEEMRTRIASIEEQQ